MSVKKYVIDKNYVLGVISARQKTVTEVAQELGFSRVNFYMALNKIYTKPRSLTISKVINYLDLDDRLVWSEAE